jgi:RNA polymerase sigma factor (sigma-70 family)
LDAASPHAATSLHLSTGVRRAVAQGWSRARRVHAPLDLPEAEYEADVIRLLERSRARLGLDLDIRTLATEVANLHHEDLYLARLCERGDERAWRAFVARFEPDLRAVLGRRSDPGEAETVTAEVLSEVALAPPRGGSRTRLGTYEGTGPLWAWLATFGVRALRARWRGRRERLWAVPPESTAPPAPPVPETEEAVRAFVAGLRAGWAQLEKAERWALGWKHRDGLPQRTIGRLLGVSEPTVSRLVSRGTTKLRSALAAGHPEADPTEPTRWTRLEHALSIFLESSDVPPPPSVE